MYGSSGGRRADRRHETIEQVVRAAWDLTHEHGLAGLSMRDLAARVGLKAPSLYQYFPSKHHIYDALFADGHRQLQARLAAGLDPGGDPVAVFKRGSRIFTEFSVEDPVRHQLLFQRTIAGFEPSEASMALSWTSYRGMADALAATGVTGQADLDLWASIQMGLTEQQLANDPGGRRFTDLLDPAIDMFLTSRPCARPDPKEAPMTSTLETRATFTDDLLALVAEHGPASDESGHLAPPVVDALAATGINRLLLPVELGGYAAPPRRAAEVVEQLAAVDGSTAWAAAIGFGTNYFAGYLPPDGAAEVFADPDRSNASMFAPMGSVVVDGEGRERLSGRWPFTSNSEQAGWLGLAALFPGEPAPRLVFARRDAVAIDPTWDVVGLRATGSHDVVLADHPVDRRLSCCFADRPWAEGTLWQLPLFAALAPPLAAVALGLARGALDEVNRQALARRAQMRGSLLDDPVGMSDLAAADARLRGARSGLLAACDDCWSLAVDGVPIDRSLQARAFVAAQHCVDVATDVVGTAHRLGGGAAAYRASPLLRAVRDVSTMRQHAMFNHGLRAPLARIIAGTDEALPPFVI